MNTFTNLIKKSISIALKFLAVLVLCLLIVGVGYYFFESKYSGSKEASAYFARLDQFATEYCKQNNSELIHIGDFTESTNGAKCAIWLRCNAMEDFNQAKNRAGVLVRSLFDVIHNDPFYTQYFDMQKQKFPNVYTGLPKLSEIAVKIAYWDKNNNRPQSPYIAEVTFLNNKYFYYRADPQTQALDLIFEESYDLQE